MAYALAPIRRRRHELELVRIGVIASLRGRSNLVSTLVTITPSRLQYIHTFRVGQGIS